MVSDPEWNQHHWRSIVVNYARAAYFRDYHDFFEELYLSSEETYLSEINYRFISAICHVLGVNTKLTWSSEYQISEGKTERLLDVCRQAGATDYLSGPSAKAYLDERLMAEGGVTVHYMDYADYPEYRQLYPPFEHAVSIIDLIFNEGPNAKKYLKSFRSPRELESCIRG